MELRGINLSKVLKNKEKLTLSIGIIRQMSKQMLISKLRGKMFSISMSTKNILTREEINTTLLRKQQQPKCSKLSLLALITA